MQIYVVRLLRLITLSLLFSGLCVSTARADLPRNSVFYVQSEQEAMSRAQAMVFVPQEGQLQTCNRVGYYKTSYLGHCYPGYGSCTVNSWVASGPRCASMNLQLIQTAFVYPKPACGSGKRFVGPNSSDACVPEALAVNAEERQKQIGVGSTPGACTKYGNPCDAATGNKVHVEDDFVGGNGVPSFRRYYNSLNTRDIGVGVGWTFSYSRSLAFDGNVIVYYSDDGAALRFSLDGAVWRPDADVRASLSLDGGLYVLRWPDGSFDRFTDNGALHSEVSPAGLVTQMVQTGGGFQAVGPFGHVLRIDGVGSWRTVTLPGGEKLEFVRGNSLNQDAVVYWNGSRDYWKSYHYENPALPHALTGVTNQDGVRYATYSYDSSTGLSVGTTHVGGVGAFSFTHSGSVSTATNAAGGTDTLQFTTNLGIRNLVSRTSSVDGKSLSQEFDALNRLIRSVDEEGRVAAYTWDAQGRMLSKTEGVGTPLERTTSFDYTGQVSDSPTGVFEPGRTTQIQYAAPGLPSYVAVTSGGETRAISYTYTPYGQLATIDGPRTDVADVASFTYWDCATGAACGRLKTHTNAAGHVTSLDAYDGNGRLTRMTSPAGVVTTYTYDWHGNVLTVTEASGSLSRVSTFTYSKAGVLLSASLPGGVVLTYSYSPAGKLLSVADNLGNSVSYQYDLMGNRTQEIVKAGSTLQRQVDLVYNARGFLQSINAGGSLTQLQPNALGQVASSTDPNGRTTNNYFDSLGRLISTVDPLGGNTGRGYDQFDQLSVVNAPNGAQTTYTITGLGDQLGELSADRGAITRAFDAAGNEISSNDPRGVTRTTIYDALNRPVTVSYSGGGQISYLWDSCTNGAGRLCSISDDAGVTARAYDAFGRLASSTWVVAGQSFTTSYTWTTADALASITYPSGTTVTYTRDSLQRITAMQARGTTLVSNRSYRADGQLAGQTYGNGLLESRTYDAQGRLTQYSTQGLGASTYGYDAAGNITLIDGNLFGYDAVNRLTSGNDGSYSYDANGNRLADRHGSFSYSVASNRLSAAPAGAVTLDAAGNTLSDHGGARAFTYNQAGRMATATLGGSTTIYSYNALGQRATKSGASGVTRFVYDLEGRVLAEIDGAGNTLREFFWDDQGRPVATYASGQMLFVQADHLGSPRAATDVAREVRWRWYELPFGTAAAGGDVTINLRYPGQYFDAETGLHQNWWRTYDPQTGRYIESDPIGVAGGANTYAYVGGNPIILTDPTGKCPWCFAAVVGGLVGGGFNLIGQLNGDGPINIASVGIAAASGFIGGATGSWIGSVSKSLGSAFVMNAVVGSGVNMVSGIADDKVNCRSWEQSVGKNWLIGAVFGGAGGLVGQSISNYSRGFQSVMNLQGALTYSPASQNWGASIRGVGDATGAAVGSSNTFLVP